MQDVLHLLVGGLATGAIYALVAAGLTLQFQMTGAVNFAQGEFVMAPAFVMLMAANLGLPVWAAILVGMAIAMLLLGVVFKVAVVGPIGRHGAVPLTLATLAIGLFLHEALKAVFGEAARPMFTPAFAPYLDFGGISLPTEAFVVIVVVAVMLAVLVSFLGDTRTGRAMQAIAQNPVAARVVGVPVGRMLLLAFVLNSFLTGIASLLIGLPGRIGLADGVALAVASIAAMVLGRGSLPGAIAAALLLGVLENVAAPLVPVPYRNAIVPLVLVAAMVAGPRVPVGRTPEPAQ
ncbi:MAG: branched-chain amino acid ABC transporter permease [Alphaproteobacteria bacterium]|nr:branched-chain amino acid ABC transporter permease [Alphaproteobacteria bacterium]